MLFSPLKNIFIGLFHKSIVSFHNNYCVILKTQLGPTYGSPIKKMQVLPGFTDTESSASYLAYITNDKIGLQILPVDGNPHRSSALICHAEGVSSFTCSCDGKYIFTAGGEDCIVYLWETNLNALEAAATLGGKDLDPFYELINGGRDGELFRELEDYFYYCQIRCQGIDCMEPRQVSTTIPLSEVPFVMRALGFYPTEQEIDDMQNEVKFSEYVNTGKYVTEVDIGEFLKLFINHRPAFGISRYEVQKAFEFLGYDQENGEHLINRKELLQLLQSRGEHLTEEDLAEYFSTLLGLNPEGGRFEPGYCQPHVPSPHASTLSCTGSLSLLLFSPSFNICLSSCFFFSVVSFLFPIPSLPCRILILP
uniref:WD repeat domain 66 n=1 Tax=Erpetoichthys calabaricus TaxID=27687 RepID=A0A8C4SKV8_ERPCA